MGVAGMMAVAGGPGGADAGSPSWSVGVSFFSGCAAPAPVVCAPAPVYMAPAPVYVAPQPVYVAPQPVYVAPQPVYVQAPPVYMTPPEQVYVAPQPVYVAAPAPQVVTVVRSCAVPMWMPPPVMYGRPMCMPPVAPVCGSVVTFRSESWHRSSPGHGGGYSSHGRGH